MGTRVTSSEQSREFWIDERERLADTRDVVADERERAADLREHDADKRDLLADQRDARADERDELAQRRDVASDRQSVREERLDHSFEVDTEAHARIHPADRADSARMRELAAWDRAMAASDRRLDRKDDDSESAESANRELAARERDVAADVRDDARDDRDERSATRDDAFAEVVDSNFERRPIEREHAASDRDEAAGNRERSADDRSQSAHDRNAAAAAREGLLLFHRETIEALSEEQTAALRESQRDPLTGLPNRHQMNERLAAAFSDGADHSRTVALIFIDVDNFKPINDEFGYLVGDDVLKLVAARLAESADVDDLVARIGGDEFVVITNAAEPLELAQRLRSAAGAQMSIGPNAPANVTVSVGVASAAECANSGDILSNADIALHIAKNSGRDQCVLFAERHQD